MNIVYARESDTVENGNHEQRPSSVETRNYGVSDIGWEELQRDKEVQEALERRYLELKSDEKGSREALKLLEKAETDTAAQSSDGDEQRRQHELARIRHEQERRKQEAILEALREAEEKRRKEQQAQAKLRRMGVCVQGFRWIKDIGGYRCAGGSHRVSDKELERH